MKGVLERAVDLSTLLIGCCAVIVTGIVVARELRPTPQASGGNPSIATVDDWQVLADGGHHAGPSDASVTIVEFGDYECPLCKEAVPHLDAIRRKYPSDVRLVYRHLPLSQHPSAYPAARAAECAGEQGVFWEFHDALYSRSAWQYGDGYGRFAELARNVGVGSLDRFNECLDREGPVPAIAADQAAANDAGLAGTPTFVINGDVYRGVVDSLEFEAILEAVRRK